MSLTKRDNLRNVLTGGEPAWVPFALNFAQWFGHHRTFGTLPVDLRGCASYIQAMKVLGCDIFSRNLDGGYRERDTLLKAREHDVSASTGSRRTITYETPYGTLQMVRQQQVALSTSHEEEHFVKDWDRDGDAFRYLLDQRVYEWDEAVFDAVDREVGDDGLVNVPVACTPLKMLHNQFGLAYSCLFVVDHPEAAQSICDLYWAKLRPLLQRLAAHPRVASVILMDNVDTPFYPPALARLYWAPYVKEAAALMRANGKYLFVHACGKLAGLSPIFADCRVTGLEGVAHPPLADWTAPAAQACHPDFIFMGGFGAHEQESMGDAEVRAFYAGYLARASRRRFIFSSSCQTSIHTPWDRIKLVRDICRAWGGAPTGASA
ncbi:MAG: hypothetical protein K8T26_08635 [Lentisphaerae bacterium]|nr:hypothetical protein [Lentisphaerota bacterium]